MNYDYRQFFPNEYRNGYRMLPPNYRHWSKKHEQQNKDLLDVYEKVINTNPITVRDDRAASKHQDF